MPSSPPPDYEKAVGQQQEQQQEQQPQASNPPAAPRRGPLPLDLPIIKYLNSKRVILASASPRRRALLGQIGLTKLEIVPSTEPENVDKSNHTPEEYVLATARQKCLSVYSSLVAGNSSSSSPSPPAPDPDVVISADTIVTTRSGLILEKPSSPRDHLRTLLLLRDTVSHRVLTAVCVLAPRADARSPGYLLRTHVEATEVFFAGVEDGLGDDVVDAYVRTREGVDKAGGYAVQGVGGLLLVDKIVGAVDNVVGLPVRRCLALAEKVVFRQDEDEEGEGEGSDDEVLV